MIMPLNMLDLVLMLTRSPGMSHKIWQISQFQVKYPEIFSTRKRAKFAQAVSWACYNRLLMRLEKIQTRASKNLTLRTLLTYQYSHYFARSS